MTRVVVIGGGYAGLCAAASLAPRGHDVVVVEREPQLCTHSSGRNAAMFRHLEPTAPLVELAHRSRRRVDAWTGHPQWLRPAGALYVAPSRQALAGHRHAAEGADLAAHWVDLPQIADIAPWAAGGNRTVGLHVPADGVMDIHAMQSAARAVARAHGAQFVLHQAALHVEEHAGRVKAVRADSTRWPADVVINAAGAWAGTLCRDVGAGLDVVPYRRHLVQLHVARPHAAAQRCALWALDDDECYVRPEGDGILASPGDAVAHEPCLPVPTEQALHELHQRLARLCPTLAQATVQRHWACLRTFARDGHPVVGADPRLPGLFWFAALGGHGMTLGAALGDVLADAVDGTAPPAWLGPERLHGQGGLDAVA